VSGSHSYNQTGAFQLTLTIIHESAAQTVVMDTVVVATQALLITSAGNQTAMEGASTSLNLGSFSDTNSNANSWAVDVSWANGSPSDHYTATINWGDNTAAATGTILFSNGVFAISGGHAFTQVGTFQTTVTISHESASPTTVSGTVVVSSMAAGQVNFVDFETGDFSQLAAQSGAALASAPVLDGRFSLELLRFNTKAFAEV